MKIDNSLSNIYKISQSSQTGASKPNPEVAGKTTNQQAKASKVNIPSDFKPQVTLSKQEQKFFEMLYPKAQKEIRRYAQNQNNVNIEKGKFVDSRG